MAFADDLQNFLENRLLAMDPTIDLSPSSPAQTQVIQPTLRRFAEDPLSTDIPTFIRDRLLQEFPDMVADNGGLLEDMLTKPFQLLFEPFKREIELTRLGQSVNNATLMSDDEADSLGANWFESRDEGAISGGGVRIYFSAPQTVRVTVDKRVYTASGLNFYPQQNYFITSAQMLFNRQGNLYFLDIVVSAEKAGDEYDIDASAIIAIDDLSTALKVTNLSAFRGGAPRENNEAYLGRFDQALTERSLVTKRGVLVRTPRLFESVRALQIIGAGQDGMNRDILTGTSEGFLHMAGEGVIYGDWLFISTILYKDDGPDDSIIPQAGDTIRAHVESPGTTTMMEALVSSILTASDGKYLLLLDRSLVDPIETTQVRYALFKPGYLTISNIPGGMASESFTVPNNTVHLGGHTDVFVRPTSDATVQSVLKNITDEEPVLALTDLQVPTVNSNKVTSESVFSDVGVSVGDTLVIETGTGFVGTYRILFIADPVDDPQYVLVDSLFSTATLPSQRLRGRIVRNLKIDLVSPRVAKLPFNTGSVSDLQTVVGSSDFRFSDIDIQSYGAALDDIIRILDGPDAGEYTIKAFSPILGGQGVTVDRAATATGAGLRYEVYTSLAGLSMPLVRIKSLEVIDSTGQGTGVTVPYGDAVDVRPVSALEGAGESLTTLDKRLIVFPDLASDSALDPDPIALVDVDEHTDARYSQNIEQATYIIRQISSLGGPGGNLISATEIDVPRCLYNGRRDTLLALTTRKDSKFYGYGGLYTEGEHLTSDIAESKIGDTLTVLDGPNKGQYIIQDLRVLDLWGKEDVGHRKVAIVQVDPPFPVDPIRTAINFIRDVAGSSVWTQDALFGFLQYCTDWDNPSGFYEVFIEELYDRLVEKNIVFTDYAALKAFFDPLIRTGYTVGPAAKGDLRLYFQDPVSVELYFGDDPTTFTSAVDAARKFRLDPSLSPAQILPESEDDTAATEWNRNLGCGEFLPGSGTSYAFLTSGISFPKRGIVPGDLIEFRRAINDLPARKSMTSSWMATTQIGSNVIQLFMPPSDDTSPVGYGGVDNFELLVAGQLLFIDSGPDIGAYTITKVLEQTWTGPIPVVKVQIDKTMTSSTDVAPVTVDFAATLPSFVITSGNVFPMDSLALKNAKFGVSDDGGETYDSYEHTFTDQPYPLVSDVVDDLNGDGSFTALGLVAVASGNEVVIRVDTEPVSVLSRVRVETPTSASAYPYLKLTDGDVGFAICGAMVQPGTKRLYLDPAITFAADQWVMVYAAQSPGVLTDGDDEPYLGVFKVTSTGTGDDPRWKSTLSSWIELDRSENFPAGEYVHVRWFRILAPSATPANTTLGGREISDQFVRARLYASVPEQCTVQEIPWSDVSPPDSPLNSDCERQITLSPALVDPDTQRNYCHMVPFRTLRPGVRRTSSTTMALRREGALYYMDVPVVGYGPGVEMNITIGEGLFLSGRSKIDGYTLQVDDENFAFSMNEQVSILLPGAVLPVGSTPELDNEFALSGQSLQVSYDNAPLVQDLQRFYDSPLDRITVANMLVRHFLPAYVSLDATYYGGDAEADVATEIMSYISNIDPEVAEIRTDFIQDIIKRKGATKVQLPLTLIVLAHGTDRRVRGMRSMTYIGSDSLPYFKGNFKQAYFISGPDTSKSYPRPTGEQIFLRRS
jgi:hypothetical protein